MTPERWKQIDHLAQSALERRGDQRPAFLDAACAGDDALRHEVESQIAYQQQASKFLEEPAFKHAAEVIADSQTESNSMEGRTISHYSILRKLGAGGMGEVYLAQDTTLSRKVAIKFLSENSVAGEQSRKRLVREAKAAAALELRQGNAPNTQGALDLLESTRRFEPADGFWPQTLRTMAYLKLGKGAEAADESRKILDHRGEAAPSLLWPLAHLNLARASVLQGDTTQARKSYQDFFALWKDADADLPSLIEAKKEYAALK